MELGHLHTFVAVAEERHVTRAAQRLHLSQPAVSRQLAALERSVQARLLERDPWRGVHLTAQGQAFLGGARDVLSRATELRRRLAAQAGDPAAETHPRPLRIGMWDEGLAELGVPTLRALKIARPDLAVQCRQLPYGTHAADLDVGRLDAVLAADLVLDAERARFTPLYTEGRMVALPVDHPLATAERLTAADVLDLPMVTQVPGCPPTVVSHFTLDTLRGGEPPRAHEGAGLLGDVFHEVAVTGAAITVTTAVERFYRHPQVVFRPLLDVPDTTTGIWTRRGGDADDRIACLLAVARATAADLIALLPGAVAATG